MIHSCATSPLPRWTRWPWLVLALGFLVYPGVRGASAHDLPDDFIERAIQLEVIDNHVRVQYAVGFSDRTLVQLVDQRVVERAAAGQANGLFGLDGELHSDILLKLLDEYRERQLPRLAENLTVKVNGEEVRIEPVETEFSFMHHQRFIAHLEFELPESVEPIEILCYDENYLDGDGAVRTALKARRRAMIAQTNVAPILIRADRIELDEMVESQRIKATEIRATIVLMPSPDL